MAALVGSCYKDVCLMFLDLPSRDISLHGDPLATRLLPTKLYLLRLREVDAVHSVQYKVNTSYIETLYSHVNKATERVAQCILAVTGGTHSAQQAAAALRSCRVLETPDEIRKRTMVHLTVGTVCKEDPVAHAGRATFVWRSPEMDKAFAELADATAVFQTVDDWTSQLVYDHIGMFQEAIGQQQQTICRLITALSEQAVLMQLTQILKYYRIPKQDITTICAKVAARTRLWTDGIPQEWLVAPAKATHSSHAKHPSCVVVEEMAVVAQQTAVAMQQPPVGVTEPSVVVEEVDVAVKDPAIEAEEPPVIAKEVGVDSKGHDANVVVVVVEADMDVEEAPVGMEGSTTAAGGNKNSSSRHGKGRRLFVRFGKVVAAAGVTVASMLAARYGARVIGGCRLR